MNRPFCIFVLLTFCTFAYSQKSNDSIAKQIRSLKADKNITLSYDAGSDTSKIMVSADDFDSKEASKARIQAMNFGMAFFYAGKALQTPPEKINLTFWVQSKKPQFAALHNWIVKLAKGSIDLGDARYAAKPGENMEYLNFKLSRSDLAKIAAETGVKFKLGIAEFTFTPAHLAIFKDLTAITDTH
ncbi:hypothetical protein BH10ACI3_BH10ACI3_07530 [soil metagenome]